MSIYPYFSSSTLRSREFRSLTGYWTPDAYATESQVTTAADDLPVTVADAKKWLRVTHSQDDNAIEVLIGAVTEQIEKLISRDLMQKTRTERWDKWGNFLYLSYYPVGSVTSVTTYDNAGNATVLTANTDYYVRGLERKYIDLVNATGATYIQVVYVSGSATAAEVPGKYKAAIYQELSAQYKNRQSSQDGSIAIINNITAQTRMLLQTDLLANEL